MDDRMADSQMMGNIQSDAFDDGFKSGKNETLQKVKEKIMKWSPSYNQEKNLMYRRQVLDIIEEV